MPDYQTLYPYLFNRVTDAVTALQARTMAPRKTF